MNANRIVAIALIVLGVLGLAYGGFSYTRDSHQTQVGPIELSVTDKERVSIPMWAGIGAVLIGGLLLVVGSGKD
jgi:hypothetical protein